MLTSGHIQSTPAASPPHFQVYTSIDLGTTWTLVYTDTNKINDVVSSSDFATLAIATAGSGILVSTDSGHTTWTAATGTTGATVKSITASADGTKMYALSSTNGASMLKSANSGAAFTVAKDLSSLSGARPFISVITDPDTGLNAVTVLTNDYYLLWTTNQGTSWGVGALHQTWR